MYLKDLKKGDIFSFTGGKGKLRHLVVAVVREPSKHDIHYYALDETNAPGKKQIIDLLISDWDEVEIVK